MKTCVLLTVFSMLLSVAIGIAIATTADHAAPGATGGAKPMIIGLSLDTLKETRWQADRDAFVAKAKELGADVLVESANSDDTVQVQNVTGLLSRGVSVLVIAPHNADAMVRAVELATAQGVPVIAYDRLIRSPDVTCYMSFDNVRVGREQGQFIADQLPKFGSRPMQLVRIYGAKSDNNAILFKQGQDEVLKPLIDAGKIKIVQEDWADDWRQEAAKRIVNAAITKAGHNIDAVLASNDGTAGGAIQALSEEGLAGKVIVTGQDAEIVACQRIMQGTQAMTIYKPVKDLAARAAEVSVALIKGKPIIANGSADIGRSGSQASVPAMFLNIITVTQDNLDEAVIKGGFHTHDEIYGKP